MANMLPNNTFKNTVSIIIVILVAANTFFIGWTYYNFRHSFPTSATMFGYRQELAKDLSDYNRRMARELNVLNRPAVREALASFNYDVEMASNSDELSQVIVNQGRRIQEIILREAEEYFEEQLIAVINQDSNIRSIEDKTIMTMEITEGGIVTSPPGVLLEPTLDRLKELIPQAPLHMDSTIELDIADGRARRAVSYNPVEHMQGLTEEIDSLRLRLHETRVAGGHAEMSGPGITIYLYDEVEGLSTNSIIHDADVRDVVNELFGSGAAGVSVGGYRLIVNSNIRCSGSLIKVDDKLITVNPVVIKAVGNPDLLISGLEIIRTNMEVKRGITFDIERTEEIKLPAFTRTVE